MRSSVLFVLGLVAVVGATVGACAQASGEFEGGGGSDSSSKSSANASSGGMGGATAGTGGGTPSSSSSGAGGTGSASSGAGGSGCQESPCKLVTPQCGCGVDEQCSLDGTLAIGCIPAGTANVGQACGGGTDCAPGLLCVTPAMASVSVCEKFCDDDNQCVAPGGLCVLTLSDGAGGTLPGVTLCSENCDPANGASCPVAGTGCTVAQESMGQMRFFTLCGAAGAGGQDANCTANKDCQSGFGCFNTGGASDVCLKYCKINGQACPGGAQCVPITVNMTEVFIGAEQYGACLN